MTEYRLCNTSDLRVLSSKAGKGRALSSQLSARLDPEGNHLLHLELWGIDMDAANAALAHRTRVMCKVIGTDEPEAVWLDIRDSDWRILEPYATPNSVSDAEAEADELSLSLGAENRP